MSFNVEGKYADWEIVDEGISNLQSAIDWAKSISEQDKIKVRVINNLNNSVVWSK
jgi:hypothetical protein